jgi:hypothetical protein
MAAGETGATVVVGDTDRSWERVVLGTHRVVVVAPAELQPGDVQPGQGVRALVVNLAAPAGLAVLRAHAPQRVPVWACVSEPGSDRMISFRRVAVVPALRPIDPVAALVRRCTRRRLRVVAAGREARALIALRHALAVDGIGVSLAWDAHQLRDVCELVHPQLVVADLGLPRSAHDAILTLGLRRHVPDLVLAADGDDARAFATAFARTARRERLPRRHEGLGLLLALAVPPAFHPRRAHG